MQISPSTALPQVIFLVIYGFLAFEISLDVHVNRKFVCLVYFHDCQNICNIATRRDVSHTKQGEVVTKLAINYITKYCFSRVVAIYFFFQGYVVDRHRFHRRKNQKASVTTHSRHKRHGVQPHTAARQHTHAMELLAASPLIHYC